MDKEMRETVLKISHADGSHDEIRIAVPAWMDIKEEADFIAVLMEGMPRAACMPVKAWIRFLGPHKAEGGLGEAEAGLGEQKKPIESGSPSIVLYRLIRRMEEHAGVKPILDGANITIRTGLASLRPLAFDGWEKKVVRSCCALLRTSDGRALARMRVEAGQAYSLWISDEETGRTASFRLEYWHLPHIAGRLIEGWERAVGRVRFDEEKGLHFVRCEWGAEVGIDLAAADGLRQLARALGLEAKPPAVSR
ncbi:hypothetical protein [Thermoflexus sp.]|jgi:hypothetical protein|uniref:hypothetical protein n=1 Tax=Thermoflexus sp. TaxID=1969742 RepID=UPI003BFD1E72